MSVFYFCKKIIRYIFILLQITMNLNLTILSSKLWKNTYFESILSIAFADKAIVCFIVAIFSRVYDVKTSFDVKWKNVFQ